MLKLCVLAGIAAIGFAIGADSANAGEAKAEALIPQSGERAGDRDPPCGGDSGGIKADVVLNAIAGSIDYMTGGNPVASTILAAQPPGNREWLMDRLGIPKNGPATCQTLCVVYSTSSRPTFETCISESGTKPDGVPDAWQCKRGSTPGEAEFFYNYRYQPGEHNHNPNNEADNIHAHARTAAATTAARGNSTLFCVIGKNWAHNRDRRFSIKASW